MSDTLQAARTEFLRRLEEHRKRYAEDPDYRKWFDSLNKEQKPIHAIGGW